MSQRSRNARYRKRNRKYGACVRCGREVEQDSTSRQYSKCEACRAHIRAWWQDHYKAVLIERKKHERSAQG